MLNISLASYLLALLTCIFIGNVHRWDEILALVFEKYCSDTCYTPAVTCCCRRDQSWGTPFYLAIKENERNNQLWIIVTEKWFSWTINAKQYGDIIQFVVTTCLKNIYSIKLQINKVTTNCKYILSCVTPSKAIWNMSRSVTVHQW